MAIVIWVSSAPMEDIIKIIQVGKVKEYKGNYKPNILYSYRDVNYDLDEWADANKYLPKEYDLCLLKTDIGRTINGWHNGTSWDGLRLKDGEKIKFWQKKREIIDHRS